MNLNQMRRKGATTAKTLSVSTTREKARGVLIALTGHMGCGKTEARKYLEGKGFTTIRIKDSLISRLKDELPMTINALLHHNNMSVDELCDANPEFVREIMQDYGALKRKTNPHIFVNDYQESADKKLAYGDNVVTDDVRFHNEALTAKELGGIIVKINRLGCDGKSKDGTRHITEADIPKIKAHYTIKNDGSINDLHRALDEILNICKK